MEDLSPPLPPLPALPRLDDAVSPSEIVGMGALFKLAPDLPSLRWAIDVAFRQARRHPDHPGLQLDLATLYLMRGGAEQREPIEMRRRALARQHLYRVAGDTGAPARPRLRLLAFVSEEAPRSMLPLDFILNGSGVRLDLLYVIPGEPLPEAVPDHDVAMVAVGESEPNRETLRWLAPLAARWPRPVVNAPSRIAALSRTGVSALLAGAEGIAIPPVARLAREEAARLGSGAAVLEEFLPGARLPLLIRPVSSHAGRNLHKIEALADLPEYLAGCDAAAFYLSSFVDYRSPDGLHRKYRIAFLRGRPFLCHLALSTHWLIHYVTAGMAESAEKRAEEERAIRDFDHGFAARHAAAFETVCARVGLDYFGLDCGESPDGRLLVFEVETAMTIHALDRVDLFPYKQEAMRRVFAAFVELLADAARTAGAGAPTSGRAASSRPR